MEGGIVYYLSNKDSRDIRVTINETSYLLTRYITYVNVENSNNITGVRAGYSQLPTSDADYVYLGFGFYKIANFTMNLEKPYTKTIKVRQNWNLFADYCLSTEGQLPGWRIGYDYINGNLKGVFEYGDMDLNPYDSGQATYIYLKAALGISF